MNKKFSTIEIAELLELNNLFVVVGNRVNRLILSHVDEGIPDIYSPIKGEIANEIGQKTRAILA